MRNFFRSQTKPSHPRNDQEIPGLHTGPRKLTELDVRISEELKVEGNEFFRRGKFAAAAEKYTEAITARPNWTVALVNRANCYKNLGKWKHVEKDCRTAIATESQSMKAHYFLGLALEAQHDHYDAIIHLEKSYELARDREDQIADEIWRTIARVSYSQWEHDAAMRREEDAKLKDRLTSLLAEAHHQTDGALQEELQSLERLFSRAAAADQPREIPSCLTCVLSMDVFRDPVVAPSGFSYERAILKEHLQRVGTFDPVTRQTLDVSQLVSNSNLRAMAHLYLKEHPWAWNECL